MELKITQVGIVGGGKMGTSIFNFLSGSNYKIVWYVRSNAEKLAIKYQRKLGRLLKNKLISEGEYNKKKDQCLVSGKLGDLHGCDLVIETIVEDLDAKQLLVNELLGVLSPEAIIASNSSSIFPALLSEDNSLKSRVVGLHFFYPVELVNIVEFICTKNTSESIIESVQQFLKHIGKDFLIQQEQDAFLLNRMLLKLQAALFNFSAREKISFAKVDATLKATLLPIGIFEMMDQIGLDLIYKSAKRYIIQDKEPGLYNGLMDFMEDTSNQLKLGVKTNHGFYNYLEEVTEVELTDEKIQKTTSYFTSKFNDILLWCKEKNSSSNNDISFAINKYLGIDICCIGS